MSGVPPEAGSQHAAGVFAGTHIDPTQTPQQAPTPTTVVPTQDLNSILSLVQTLQTHVQAQGQVISSLQQQQAAPSSSSIPNLSDPSNLAAELHLRGTNPIPRPPHLASDGVTPCLFDLSNHSGARRVKAVLGTHATFEVETLACATSFLYDGVVALEELAAAVKLIPTSGSGGQAYSVEHPKPCTSCAVPSGFSSRNLHAVKQAPKPVDGCSCFSFYQKSFERPDCTSEEFYYYPDSLRST